MPSKTKQEYLTILEILEENPTEQIIKAQYRKLSKIYHTDNISTGNKEKFILITEAKDALINKTYFVPSKGPITFENFKERSSEFSQIINEKLSEFLNIAGENIHKEKIKVKKNQKKLSKKNYKVNNSSNDYEFLFIKKLNSKTIIIFDLTDLTQDRSFIINRKIFNFKIK